MKKKLLLLLLPLVAAVLSCSDAAQKTAADQPAASNDNFPYLVDTFADIKVLRYQVPGFEELSLAQKELLYYLYEAALSGRDIFYDQNCKANLTVRRTLEAILQGYKGDKNSTDWQQLELYAKRVFYSNGIHHHYGNDKILPSCSPAYVSAVIKTLDSTALPLLPKETVEAFAARLQPIFFDPKLYPKKVDKSEGKDIIKASSVNFYENVSQAEVEAYYANLDKKNSPTEPLWYGLNSKLVKTADGKLTEQVWKQGGMYSAAIERIVFWLNKAVAVAETPVQKAALQKLVEYYQTGDLRKFDEYNIQWVADTVAAVDAVNGFIEVYDDPIGKRASFESVVSFRDMEATRRIAAIARQAQWFEDNSSLMPEHKKKNVVGISAKVITTVVESGSCAPTTPIGINLPNADWIRTKYGSKSVSLGNIVDAYSAATVTGLYDEFCFSDEEANRAKQHNTLAGKLHTDMHEVIGHASGVINAGVGSPKETLKNYASTLEEARADLVALFYITNPKLVDMGVMPNIEVGKAEYDNYIRNGLLIQLNRIEPGKNLEEDHMRNRQLVAAWVYEKGKKDNVIERKTKNGNTYFVINDYAKLQVLFGELLREIQRIKSEGDFAAGKKLVETYGVKVDQALLKEVHQRYKKLHDKPYKGFVQPTLEAVTDANGKITDVKINYNRGFVEQMLEYGKKYSFLPNFN